LTRESIPEFDLYAELEVEATASGAAIEAAHRTMAKRHHPDLAGHAAAPGTRPEPTSEGPRPDPASEGARDGGASCGRDGGASCGRNGARGGGDGASGGGADWAAAALAVAQAEERIKRINVARDWLLDPERRARYDRAVRRREAGPGTPSEAGDFEASGRPAWTSFGPNADRVRQFLGDLREVDERRAFEIRDGKASIDPDDYAHARRAAFAISRSRRLSEWLFSRDAALNAMREQLGDTRLGNEVGDVVAEIAGAIAVEDLLPPRLFETLMEPWVWRGRQVAARASRPITMSTTPSVGLGGRPVVTRAATPPPAPVATRASAATPPPAPVATREPRAPRQQGVPKAAIPILAASTVALLVVATLIGAATLLHPPFTGGVAGIEASGGSSVNPNGGTGGNGGGAASAAPTPPSGPGGSQVPGGTPAPGQTPAAIDPTLLASLRAGAADTIAKLQYDAARGLVRSAQRLLGDTAPGLQASGLRRATFPDVAPEAIGMSPDATGSGWIATAGNDTLTSTDGAHWTFDYGARPLAHFGKSAEHDLFWIGGSGTQHDVLVTITSTTVTLRAISMTFSWGYGPDSRLGSDAPYFVGTSLVVAGITVDGVAIDGASGTVSALGTSTATARVKLPATIAQSGTTTVHIQVVNGGSLGSFGTIDAEITLAR
jgi:curved DNA-binding protein CbpA